MEDLIIEALRQGNTTRLELERLGRSTGCPVAAVERELCRLAASGRIYQRGEILSLRPFKAERRGGLVVKDWRVRA
jgi:hypothetical protein